MRDISLAHAHTTPSRDRGQRPWGLSHGHELRQLHTALDALNPIDREILAMRHFEQLTNSETAQVLGLRESTASQRYARALLRLRDLLRALPGFSQVRP